MLVFVITGWLLTIVMLVVFFQASSEMQQLFFLGSLGAPLMMPLVMLILTVLVCLE